MNVQKKSFFEPEKELLQQNDIKKLSNSQTFEDMDENYYETDQFTICSKKLGLPMDYLPTEE